MVKDPAKGPAAVGRRPVELLGSESGGALNEEPRGLVDAPTTSRSVGASGSRSSGSVTVDGTQPSVGTGTRPSRRHLSHWSIWFR